MSINVQKTAVYVLAWPNMQCHWRLSRWLWKLFPEENCVPINIDGVTCARNTLAEHVLKLRHKYEYMLMVDKDIVPTRETEYLLEGSGDACCVATDIKGPQLWQRPDAFHCAMFWVRVDALARVRPPWFQMGYNERGTKRTFCECNYFKDKLKASGLTVRNAGFAHHRPAGPSTWYGCT